MNFLKNTRFLKKTYGFTLVEMLTVIVIIMFLAGMMIPVLRGVIAKSKITQTSALINRINAALRLYESDYRDYPPSTVEGGGAIIDTITLCLGIHGKYEQFNEKERKYYSDDDDGKPQFILIDAWKHPLIYCHFVDYDPDWEDEQPWRFEKSKYKFQLLSGGILWDELNSDNTEMIENSELSNLNGSQVKEIIKNW